MIRDITIGQYYPGDSWIHRLDPRSKIIITLIYIVQIFFAKDFLGFAAVVIALAVTIGISKVPVNFIFRGLKPILLIILFTFVINMFMIDGRVLVKLGFLTITREGLYTAFFMAVRLILLIIGSSMLTFVTKPVSLTDGIEALLSPFRKLGLPAHELAMMMVIALRFIPTLIEETDKIMSAQKARGADFDSGNIFQKAKALVPILVPLFISAFRRADELATAMECRCYHGGEGRTKLHVLKYQRRDYVALAGGAVILALVVVLRRLGI